MITAAETAEDVARFLAQRSSPLRIAYDANAYPTIDTLSLAKLDRVVSYEPEEMVIVVEPGITLIALETLLAAKGQWIPTIVTSEIPETSLGAAVINDHYHPRAASLGMLRTSILGGTFCTTDGTIFKSGSRVVKSVAGYDIHRAFCGSRGKFGAILSLTMKVQPKPEHTARFAIVPAGLEIARRLNPSVLIADVESPIIELSGYSEDVEQAQDALREHIHHELSDAEWSQMLGRVRASHLAAESDSEVATLLSNVRAVFDPKHILV